MKFPRYAIRKMAPPDTIDRPNRHHWPPILYVGMILVSLGIERLLAPPPLLPSPIAGSIGWPLFALGIAVGIAALWRFHKIGTSFDPTAPAAALATGGLYRITRNPMYVGALMAFLGFGLAWPASSLAVLTIPLAYALRRLAIEPEEAYLERRFGSTYVEYKSSVRRWL